MPDVRRWAALMLLLLGCASGAPAARDAGPDAAPPPPDARAPAPATDAGGSNPRDSGRPPPVVPPDDDAGEMPDGAAGAPAMVACDDGMVNGEETARDCGGSACTPCALGARCLLDRDCAVGECTQQVCACGIDADAGAEADCEKPHPSCGPMQQHGGHVYYVCPTALSWSAARVTCQTNPRFDLIRIDSASEQTFLQNSITSLTDDVWLNATDMMTDGSWAWMDDATVFWQGDSTGAAVGGRFSDWASGAPTSTGDCVRHVRVDAAWRNAACTETDFFVCEAVVP